jgi:glycosyltransferase involved in cell wall biosynthesis
VRLDEITPLLLTFDEERNIGRALECLSWAKQVVVLDSHSGDETARIVGRYPNARMVSRKFDSHAAQWNFGLRDTGITTDWVLALDADYVVTGELVAELGGLAPPPGTEGYRASFVYCIDGKPLRSAVYPPVTVLYRRANAMYVQDGHTQRVRLEGPVLALSNPIFHDDRKPWRRWLRSQDRYMRLESSKLVAARFKDLPPQDRIRRLVLVAPAAMFFYCLFVKGNILDGRAGLLYALQRTVAEAILAMHLVRAAITRSIHH